MDFFYLFKDINFQKGFLLIAMFILVLVILNVAYELSKTQGGQEEGWPPTTAPCPDYWDLSGEYCINSTGMNLGDNNNSSYNGKKLYNDNPVNGIYSFHVNKMNVHKKIGYTKRSKNSKKNFAKIYGFIWDGIVGDKQYNWSSGNKPNFKRPN